MLIDKLYDEKLNILTSRDYDMSVGKSGYVPASYFFLEQIFTIFPFEEHDNLVDFGCGKGRVLFMAANKLCKHVTGYEINEKTYNLLEKNVANYRNKFGEETSFNLYKEDAQYVKISEAANKFFFFNPFHLKIYIKVINLLIASLKK